MYRINLITDLPIPIPYEFRQTYTSKEQAIEVIDQTSKQHLQCIQRDPYWKNTHNDCIREKISKDDHVGYMIYWTPRTIGYNLKTCVYYIYVYKQGDQQIGSNIYNEIKHLYTAPLEYPMYCRDGINGINQIIRKLNNIRLDKHYA